MVVLGEPTPGSGKGYAKGGFQHNQTMVTKATADTLLAPDDQPHQLDSLKGTTLLSTDAPKPLQWYLSPDTL